MRSFYCQYLKRWIDVFISGIAIVLLSPILVVIAIWIKLDSPGPVLFRQKRVGKNKTYFNILKYRTMRIDTPHDVPTHQLSHPDMYITRSGRLLRRTSIDELPQLFNIFIGQMSIIGPRPALWNQDDLIAERDAYNANNVTPGLTGWAQINGRDALEIKDKARYDGEYCRNVSFSLDWKCFQSSVRSVLKHDGVVEGGTGMLCEKQEYNKTIGVSEVNSDHVKERMLE